MLNNFLHNPDYEKLGTHAIMLSDKARMLAYRLAIERNVKPGSVVIDVGCGTGILSLFAAKAGAKKVYAVEKTANGDIARRIIAANGLEGKIELVHSDMEGTVIPEKADCIISEWMGYFGIQENLLPVISGARDKFLKPEGIVLPDKVNLYLAPIEYPKAHQEIVARWNLLYGFDFRDFASEMAQEMHVLSVPYSCFLSPPVRIKTIDVTQDSSVEFSAEANFKVVRHGVCHGFVGWFDAEFMGGTTLDTSPYSQPTHWKQTYFPVADPLTVSEGLPLYLRIVSEVDPLDQKRVSVKRILRFKD